FGEAEKLGAGSWLLNACPMDGGGLALGPDGTIITTWRRASDVYVVPRGAVETRIEAGKDSAIAAAPDGVYAVWSQGGAVRARVPGKPDPIVLAEMGGFPQVLAVPGGPVLAAWEHHGRIVVEKVP
ncbi:MAG: hypothetical protein ACRD96_13035, partial [Bryobacteraceae bacterium]